MGELDLELVLSKEEGEDVLLFSVAEAAGFAAGVGAVGEFGDDDLEFALSAALSTER